MVLLPLIFELSEFKLNMINYDLIVPILFIVISILLISKIPTYSLKKIAVPRKITIFLLLFIILYFGSILIYTFNAILISGLIYLTIIPISAYHYLQIKNNIKIQEKNDEDQEDIL